MTQEIRLPKCLTQEEQESMRDYIDGVVYEAKCYPDEPNYSIKGIFLYYKRDIPWTRRFDPFGEFYPCRFSFKEGSFNYTLNNTLEDVLTESFSKAWEEVDILCFFCRAYAMAIHSLNYPEPQGDYAIFSELWQDEKLIERKKLGGLIQMSLTDYDKTQCELICACMVYCILERENEPKTKRLLHHIKLRLKKSESGINLETLETFRQAVAESIGKKTQPSTNEQNTTEPTPPVEAQTPTIQKDAASITRQKEEKIKNAIKTLLAEKFGDKKGKFKSANWYAVYRVYETNYQQGISYKVFSDLMKEWQLTKTDIANDISKAANVNDVMALPQKLSQWRDHRPKAGAAAKRHIDVALKFLELLR